jgi:ubiquinone/menaquinone biosynthesis C-methylase UbiE
VEVQIPSQPQATAASTIKIESHLDLFKCPNTGLRCVLMSVGQLCDLNESIQAGRLLHVDGTRVQFTISSALLSKCGTFIYPIIDGIVCFLPRLAIARTDDAQQSQQQTPQAARLVSEFYDEFGWQKASDGNFCDAAVFEDLRDVSSEYIHKCHMRLNQHITGGGKYLLDIASGPVQYDEYLSYSSDFEYRICADLSIVALREARQRIGSKGIFVLADITNLPFADESIDCVISLHTIYHVDEEQQRQAFEELYRVVKPSRSAIVVYTWGPHCRLMGFFESLASPTGPLRPWLKEHRNEQSVVPSTAPMPYYKPHDYEWFSRQRWSFQLQTFVWRSLSVSFLRSYVHASLFGRHFLKSIYWLEDRCPRFMGRFGQYPLFVLSKPARSAGESP